jgi:uncharacterized phiE125 gp8 family phage protein
MSLLKLIRIAEPIVDVVSDAEQKAFSKIDLTDDDALVTTLNETATRYITDRLQRSLVFETFENYLDAFPQSGCPIEICRTPLSSVTSITYTDTDGNPQTLAATEYKVDDKIEPAAIWEAFQKTWPSTRDEVNSVKVTFVAGFGAAATDVGEEFKTIIKHMFAHLYEHREPMKDKTWVEIPEHLNALIAKYEIKTFG